MRELKSRSRPRRRRQLVAAVMLTLPLLVPVAADASVRRPTGGGELSVASTSIREQESPGSDADTIRCSWFEGTDQRLLAAVAEEADFDGFPARVTLEVNGERLKLFVVLCADDDGRIISTDFRWLPDEE